MKYDLKEIIKTININQKYKDMIYEKDRKRDVLLDGKFKGYRFIILNLGTHPTAYIEIPIGNKLFGKDYEEIYRSGLNLDVHGGLTYSRKNLLEDEESWFIGWDYAHLGDYLGYELGMPNELRIGGKKWTTQEIFNEVCCAIDQIIEYVGEES